MGYSGAGGGALEIGAVGTLTLSSTSGIYALGGSANFGNGIPNGGGRGGGLLLHGNSVDVEGDLGFRVGVQPGFPWSNQGISGGFGGGGRVAIMYDTNGTFTHSDLGGGGGVLTVATFSAIPEPAPLVLGAVVSLLGFAGARVRKSQASVRP